MDTSGSWRRSNSPPRSPNGYMTRGRFGQRGWLSVRSGSVEAIGENAIARHKYRACERLGRDDETPLVERARVEGRFVGDVYAPVSGRAQSLEARQLPDRIGAKIRNAEQRPDGTVERRQPGARERRVGRAAEVQIVGGRIIEDGVDEVVAVAVA